MKTVIFLLFFSLVLGENIPFYCIKLNELIVNFKKLVPSIQFPQKEFKEIIIEILKTKNITASHEINRELLSGYRHLFSSEMMMNYWLK